MAWIHEGAGNFPNRCLSILTWQHPTVAVPVPPHPKCALLNWSLVSVKAVWVQGTRCLGMFQKPDEYTVVTKGWVWSVTILRYPRCPKCGRKSSPTPFFGCFMSDSWWVCVRCCFSFPLLTDRSGIWCSLLLLLPICLKVWWVITSGHLSWLLPSYQLQAVWQFWHFCPESCHSLDISSYSDHSL